MRRIFRHLQIGTGPRRSPSACSDILGKKDALGVHVQVVAELDDGSVRQQVSDGLADLWINDAAHSSY